MKKFGKKAYVGMSGGVDSSVSAAMLQNEGYDVTGVFIKVWQPDFMPCSWKEERREAMRVCAHLGIPFLTLDLEKEYKKEVVDYMIDEYKKGHTPNPDVMCNKYIKFGGFFDLAIKNNADVIATGHYARIKRIKDKFVLLAGNDKNKDQSYFLWTLKQKHIAKTIFPVGNFEKSQVRRLAKKFNLPNAEKKDSQGLCFIGKVDMKEFLTHYINPKPGNVLNEKKEIIGEHQGAIFYTLGERHGFKILKKTSDDLPYFVIDKNIGKNTLTVSNKKTTKETKNNKPSANSEFIINNVNWICKIPEINKIYSARIRYRGESLKVKVENLNMKNSAKVRFLDAAEMPTSGQSLVVYDKHICLGGGVID